MVKKIVFSMAFVSIFLCFLTQIYGEKEGHTEKGSNYGETGVFIYSQTKHGPDGAIFLDPFFTPFLENLHGLVLLDAGCGAGPWGILAAKNGAVVCGIDIQNKMIEQAKIAAAKEGVSDKTTFFHGDVGSIPYSNDFFDRAISINVGCNLPSLEKHIQELHRVMKKETYAIITAPTSFGVLFTDGSETNEEVIQKIQRAISSATDDTIQASLQNFNDVYRATFAKRDGKWQLVLNESDLKPGEEIWRKIPNMVVPNRYHSEQEYLAAFEKNGFILKQSISPRFSSEHKRNEYNETHDSTLSSAYVNYSPFVIFIIEKR